MSEDQGGGRHARDDLFAPENNRDASRSDVVLGSTLSSIYRSFLLSWSVSDGQHVTAGQEIAMVEIRATGGRPESEMVISAPVAGVFSYGRVSPGDGIQAKTVVGTITYMPNSSSQTLDSRSIDDADKVPPIQPELQSVVIPKADPGYRWYVSKWLRRNHSYVHAGDSIVRLRMMSTVPSSRRSISSSSPRSILVMVAPTTGTLLRQANRRFFSSGYDPGSALFAVNPPKYSLRDIDGYEPASIYPTPRQVAPPQHATIRPAGPPTPTREPPEQIRAAISAPTADANGIFISYRRSDQAAFAGRLYDRLVAHFDSASVFMDVDSIDLGLDFVEALQEALRRCTVLIVVIGRDWLTCTDTSGQRRLENPYDFVRLEIETALKLNLRVIPMLVENTPMPKSAELPPSLASLARRNGREVSNARFGSDTIELINTLRRILDES